MIYALKCETWVKPKSDQHHLLSTSSLHLAGDIAVGQSRGRYFLLKNVREQKYLIVDRLQRKVLQRFKGGKTVAEILPRLIVDRECPALRNFYELLLKAVDAGILSDGPVEGDVVSVSPSKWKMRVNPAIARVTGYGALLLGIAAVAIHPEGIELPKHVWEGLAGYLLIGAAVSLGNFLAAGVVRAYNWDVYRPAFRWVALVPQFDVDLHDASMGGAAV